MIGKILKRKKKSDGIGWQKRKKKKKCKAKRSNIFKQIVNKNIDGVLLMSTRSLLRQFKTKSVGFWVLISQVAERVNQPQGSLIRFLRRCKNALRASWYFFKFCCRCIFSVIDYFQRLTQTALWAPNTKNDPKVFGDGNFGKEEDLDWSPKWSSWWRWAEQEQG